MAALTRSARRGARRAQEVFHAHRDDAEGNQRLDEARRRDHPTERGKGQGRGVGDGEGGHDAHQLPEAPAEQEHADEEGDVIAPLEDVLGAEPEESPGAGPRPRLWLDLQHGGAGASGPLDRDSRQPEEGDVQVALGEAIEESELHPQTAGDPGTLPARGDRDPVLLRGGHGGPGERAGRPVRAHPDRRGDLLRTERVELCPGELEHRLDAAVLDGDFSGGQPQRMGTGRRREQRAEEQRSEETAGGHGERVDPTRVQRRPGRGDFA